MVISKEKKILKNNTAAEAATKKNEFQKKKEEKISWKERVNENEMKWNEWKTKSIITNY